MNIEPILLTTVRVQTYQGGRHLTNATGFSFERDERLFLVSSLHVFIDPANDHHPDRRHDDRGCRRRYDMLLLFDSRHFFDVGREVAHLLLEVFLGLPELT